MADPVLDLIAEFRVGPFEAIGLENRIPTESPIASRRQHQPSGGRTRGEHFPVSGLEHERTSRDDPGVASANRDLRNPLVADRLQHPLDQRTREAVHAGQFQAGLLDDDWPLEPLPGSLRLVPQHLDQVTRLDLRQIDRRRLQPVADDPLRLAPLVRVAGDQHPRSPAGIPVAHRPALGRAVNKRAPLWCIIRREKAKGQAV